MVAKKVTPEVVICLWASFPLWRHLMFKNTQLDITATDPE